MSVDQDRRATARVRRAKIITNLRRAFDRSDPASCLSRFSQLVESEAPRHLVMNADIDGLVSSQMLAAVSPWRVAAIVTRTGTVRTRPGVDLNQIIDNGSLFGVDVFSPLFPGVSNHPVFFGAKDKGRPGWMRGVMNKFDDEVRISHQAHAHLNPSAWVSIAATRGSADPLGIPYKYPLGSAQILLAVLEASGHDPKFFDRQYLPWLVANCDGGVDTIRTYAWNAEGWWSALAAVVGPASQSEALYRLVSAQRPSEFLDADRRLRYDEPDRSASLSSKWNLQGPLNQSLSDVTSLITDLSGWPDPFQGGVASLDSWEEHTPTRNVLPIKNLGGNSEERVKTHLAAATRGLHVNFSVFKERGSALAWSLPGVDAHVAELLGDEAAEEIVEVDAPAVPDL